jgi:hypothetical protein
MVVYLGGDYHQSCEEKLLMKLGSVSNLLLEFAG